MALRKRKVQPKAATFESYLFNGTNGAEFVELFEKRGEHADNFGTHIDWVDPDTNDRETIHSGDRVVIIDDNVEIFPGALFDKLFETAKETTKEPEKKADAGTGTNA